MGKWRKRIPCRNGKMIGELWPLHKVFSQGNMQLTNKKDYFF